MDVVFVRVGRFCFRSDHFSGSDTVFEEEFTRHLSLTRLSSIAVGSIDDLEANNPRLRFNDGTILTLASLCNLETSRGDLSRVFCEVHFAGEVPEGDLPIIMILPPYTIRCS